MNFISVRNILIFLAIFFSSLASQASFADQAPENSVVLNYSHDYSCDPGFPSFDHTALSIRITQLQKIKNWHEGMPKLANIYGVSYRGPLNKQFNYEGLKDTFAYYLDPDVALDNGVTMSWFSIVGDSSEAHWKGSLHLQSGDKICTLDFAN